MLIRSAQNVENLTILFYFYQFQFEMLPRLLQPQKLINLRISFSIFPAKRKPKTTEFHMTSNRFKPSLRPAPSRWENSSVFPNPLPPLSYAATRSMGEDADSAGDERACFSPPFLLLLGVHFPIDSLACVPRLMRFRLHVVCALTVGATRTLKERVFF